MDLDFSSLSKARPKNKEYEPFGFSHSAYSTNISRAEKKVEGSDSFLRIKKAWDFAISPAKTLPMQMFMAWMSGSNVQIFSIFIIFMVMSAPIKGLMSINQAFQPLEVSRITGKADVNLSLQKLVYIALNLCGLAFGVYRMSIMGLLPTHTSDWMSFDVPKKYLEYGLN